MTRQCRLGNLRRDDTAVRSGAVRSHAGARRYSAPIIAHESTSSVCSRERRERWRNRRKRGRAGDALAEYQTALDRSPNRFNSLYGAGRAAELAGRADAASQYYKALLDVTAGAESQRDRLEHASAYLEGGRNSS